MTALYMLLNLGAWLVPFIFSFHHRIRFNRRFGAAIPAITAVAIPFIVWDAAFTRMNIWGFNDAYLLGWSMFGLPAEEVLFFFFIPFCCLFTYYMIDRAFRERLQRLRTFAVFFCLAASVVLVALALAYFGRWYAFTSFLTGAVTMFVLALFRPGYLVTAVLAFVVLLIPFYLVNGALTGMFTPEPVVWYNGNAVSGARAGTIPVEDFSYALVLVMANIALFERFGRIPGAAGSKNVNYK